MSTPETNEASGKGISRGRIDRITKDAKRAHEFGSSHWSVFIPELLELLDNYGGAEFSFNKYQIAAKETAIYPGQGKTLGLCYATMGLAGEAGEIANKVKKILRDKDGVLLDVDRFSISKELGDVLWYLAAMVEELGCELDLEAIAKNNYLKLKGRMERGKIGGDGDER